MKYIFLVFFFALFFFQPKICIGQELTINGSILNDRNQPLPYVNIILLQNDEEFNGTSTNDDGIFVFSNLKANSYSIKASFIGFESDTLKFNLTKSINLEPLILKEKLESLEEVQVTYRSPTLKKESDRLTFNISNSVLSEGSTLEAIKRTPGVVVINDQIKVRNTPATTYINDRKVNLTQDDLLVLLQNSPANTIQKIEVITNPSSKYDAQSGIVINVVMSKNLISGYNGSLFSNYKQGVFPNYSFGTANFFKTKQINLFASYNYSKKKINREDNGFINFLNNGNLEEKWVSNFDRNTTSETHSLSVNFDYSIDPQNTLSVTTNTIYLPYYIFKTNGETKIFDSTNVLLSRFDANSVSGDDKHNFGVDLDFKHLFRKNGKLSFNVHFTDYDYLSNQSVSSIYFQGMSTFDFSTSFNTFTNQTSNILSSKLDYELPINDSTTLSMGIKSSLINTENSIEQFDVDSSTGIQSLNLSNSNIFSYEESIFAAYTVYNKRWEKWAFSLGLRIEQTEINGVSRNDENSQDYLEWFPTANLSFQANENLYFYTNYKRSIQRPDYEYLNPFNFFLNDNIIVSGNTNLQPSFTNSYSAGVTLSDQFTIEAFYYNTDDQFFELPIQDNEDKILRYSPTNLSETRELGLYFLGYLEFSESWSFNFLSGTINTGNSALFENNLINRNKIERDLWYGYLEINNDFTFLKDDSLTASFSVLYIGKDLQGFRETDNKAITNLSFKKTMFNKKGILSLTVADLFNTQDFNVRFKFLNQDSSNFSNLDTRFVKFGFRYKFGNTNLESNERTKSSSERNRLKN